MPRTRSSALRGYLDAGVRSASVIYKEEGDLEREKVQEREIAERGERVERELGKRERWN